MSKFKLFYFFIMLLFTFNCYGANIYNLGQINVNGKLIKETKQKGDILFTGVSLSKKSLQFSGQGGKNSIFKSISILPDINLDSDDPYGLSEKRMRIRGTSDYFVGLTVNGVPNYGVMPIGPRDYIYDVENFSKIKVFTGSAPSDLMSGSGNRAGAIEAIIKEPSDKIHLTFNQNFGSFDYCKTFLRFDSGEISNLNAKFYTSLSYSDADKWKGDGKLGPRKNFSFGYEQKLGNWLNIELFGNYNSLNRNAFKGLTYYEAKDLDKYYYHDYNSEKIGNPLIDYNYYNYNRFSAINRDYFSIINVKFSKNLFFSLKPYYSKEDNSKYEGIKAGSYAFVLNKINNSKRYGLVSELNYNYKYFNATVGYWHEITDFKPIIKKDGITPKGLIFKGYGWYTKSNSKGTVLSPFIKIGLNFQKLKLQFGTKYFYYKEPEKKGYWYKNGNLIYDKNISVNKKTYSEFLPSFGIEYDLNKIYKISFNYSKKYERPYAYGPLSSFYFKNYLTFIKKNISLQELFDKLHMEKVDAYDIIFTANFQKLFLKTDIFYEKHKRILVSLNDPRVNLSYQQNDGYARSYGIEISGQYNYSENFQVFSNFSFNKMEFTKDLNRGGKIYKLNSKQFPDSPKYMFKTGIIYKINKFEIIPLFKYIGKRYGDALNIEQINPYSILNLQMNYYLKFGKIGIEADNIFNHKYIGRIDTWDDATGNTTYYAASPFTLLLKFQAKF